MESQFPRQALIDLLKPGDVLLYSGSSLISFFIKVKTWSKYSHAEVYIGDGKSVTSRDGKGVNTYDVDLSCKKILRPEVPQGYVLDLSEAIKFHESCIGQKYDWFGLFRFFKIGEQSTDKSFCSEHCTRFLRHILVCHYNHPTLKTWFKPFAEKYDADLVSPGMFDASPHFETVLEIS